MDSFIEKLTRVLYKALLLGIAFAVGYFIEPRLLPETQTKAPGSAEEHKQPKQRVSAAPKKVDTPPTPQQEDVTPPPDKSQTDTPDAADEPEDEYDDEEDDDDDIESDDIDDEGEGDDYTVDVEKARRLLVEETALGPVQETRYVAKSSRGSSWQHPRALMNELTARLRSKLQRVGVNNIPKFLEDPETRLMLAQYELLRKANMDELTALLSDGKVARSLEPLLNDLRWVSSLVYDGEFVKPEVALAMIWNFRCVDPHMDTTPAVETNFKNPEVKQRIAAAIAAEYTRQGWYGNDEESDTKHMTKHQKKVLEMMGEDNVASMQTTKPVRRAKRKAEQEDARFRLARERYLYYVQSWEQGLLNSDFDKLPGWLLRITCSFGEKSRFGTITAFKWLRDNMSVPTGRYTGIFTEAPYLPTNKFGDTIFGEWYYQPFDVLYPENFAKEVRDVGGVCMQLSPFAAAAACANGVPAITMGEPGHCSYAVFVDDKWVPSYSMSTNRMLHVTYWNLESFNDLTLMTEMFHMEGKRTRDTQMICTLAAMFSDAKNYYNSRKLYELAATMQPLYVPLWGHYLEAMAPVLRLNTKKYHSINDFFCSNLAPHNPELCAKYLTEHIYPPMLKAMRNSRKKLSVFLSYINNFDQNEGHDWDIEEVLNMQYEALGKLPSVRQKYLESIGECVQKHPEFVPALGWAVRKAMMENKVIGTRMLAMVDQMLEKLSPDDPQEAATRQALHASLIRGLEDIAAQSLGDTHHKWPDRNLCRKLINQYSRDYLSADGKCVLPNDFVTPSGNLISPGSLVTLSKYRAEQSNLIYHASALTLQGGHIQTEKGNGLEMILELPKVSYIGNIVIVPSMGCSAYSEWYIEISLDGKKWELLERLPNAHPAPYISIDIKRQAPRAKFVRINSGFSILSPGIDFKALLIYDNK